MASPVMGPRFHEWEQFEIEALSTLLSCLVTAFCVMSISYFFSPAKDDYLKDISLVNAPTRYSFLNLETKRDFVKNSKQILTDARNLFPSQPFRVLADWGELLILPAKFADEIRNDARLSFGMAAMQDNHAGIPGFETIKVVGRHDQLIQVVARKQLTKHLSAVIEPLSRESVLAISLNFHESKEWRTIKLKPAILDIIARISSRIYLGDQVCRNEEWLHITKTYTTNFYTASTNLRHYPRLLRPFVHWFLADCTKLREELNRSRRIIMPLIEKRQQMKCAAHEAGLPPPVFNDALEWAEQEAAARGTTYDPVVFQLALSLLAIHTTYDLLEQCVLDLAMHPEYIQPLREEVVSVLQAGGWKKTSLYNMKLLDSAIKESQRLKPGSMVTMRRYVKEDLTLSNGLHLRKGTRINVDGNRMADPDLHDRPEEYNPYRFLNKRSQAGSENTWQLVSTSPDHLGFGHGEHSCPGRFFASNEIKVAMCHILTKYDWKLAPGSGTAPDVKGMLQKSSWAAQIMIRRREKVEVDIDAL